MRSNSAKLILVCLGFLLFFSSCAEKSIDIVHPEFSRYRPRMVAVLPMDNMSPDLDATPLIRPIVHQRLIYKGYQCLDLKKIDQILKENGVMISHDVYMFTSEELGELLGVDALVYGTVTEFTKHYALVYSDIIVGIRLEMVDARTGEVLWKSEHTASENTLVESLWLASQFDNQQDALAAVLAYNAAFTMLSQYRPYAEEAVKKSLVSLPPGPYGARPYPWDEIKETWEDDIVELWLATGSIIATYSPKQKKKK